MSLNAENPLAWLGCNKAISVLLHESCLHLRANVGITGLVHFIFTLLHWRMMRECSQVVISPPTVMVLCTEHVKEMLCLSKRIYCGYQYVTSVPNETEAKFYFPPFYNTRMQYWCRYIVERTVALRKDVVVINGY